MLLRFAPGSHYVKHLHPEGEQYWVLEGSIDDGGKTYGVNTYVYHPPGSSHQPWSAEGCVLFVCLPRPIQHQE